MTIEKLEKEFFTILNFLINNSSNEKHDKLMRIFKEVDKLHDDIHYPSCGCVHGMDSYICPIHQIQNELEKVKNDD